MDQERRYAQLGHTHDDIYYTELEVDAFLELKSPVGHNHDLLYAALSHTHDDRYYTETESDSNFIKRVDIVVTDFNAIDPTTLTQGRTYSFNTGFQPLNRPTSENFFSGFLIVHNVGGNLSTIMCQSTGYGMYMRYFNGTNWSTWYRIWTENTDGTGSGLDADLLDGQHASDFQGLLVSGTNIKTVNGVSLLGSGDLTVTASIPSTLTTDRLRLNATDDASLTSTLHAFQIGPTTGANLIMDNNEIMARNNGAGADLFLNGDGGKVSMAQNLSYGVTTNPTVYGNPIVEKGNTGSVYWTKFYDGTIEFMANISTSAIACNTAMGAGGGFRTATQTLTLPVALVSTGLGWVNVGYSSSSMFNIAGGGYINSLTTVYWYLCSVSSDATTRTRIASIRVVGRWY